MSQASLRRGVRAAIRGLWTGALSYLQSWDAMYDAIQRRLTQAWHEGLVEFGLKPGDMSPGEKVALGQMITEQSAHIDGLLTAVFENSKARGGKLGPLIARADLWAQRYNDARERAKSMVAVNPPLMWVYGDTIDHCGSCSRVVGRVYRKETWDRYGWIPGSKSLECGGWRCACSRVPTTEPITPGRPPSL